MKNTRIIAITGGIGAGKSVVSSVLRAMGYSVYDTDSEAKRIMDCSGEIKKGIAENISTDALNDDGTINRQVLASVVFSDHIKLDRLNSLVHAAVREDLEQFRTASPADIVFAETAILYQSGLDKMVDEVWDVTAPEETRIERVMKRNSISADEVRARIKSQEYVPGKYHERISRIVNDGTVPLLPRIEELLGKY